MSDATIPIPYPTSPTADPRIIEPSGEFRKEVASVLLSILFFVVTYLVLVSLALVLAVACAYGGVMLIAAFPRFFTLMIGAGLIMLGVMVTFFLFKFIFKSTTVDRSHLTEITEQEQPVLFGFIRKLARETQVPFPKKIFVSSDVNASVFYNSGFRSMFLPVRKNLQIGLGLVNSVNVSEFKAMIAHEFGHFSQRSMKLGSYVYNVNKVIHNMLYDNDGYLNTLQWFANIHGTLAFFAIATSKLAQGIQWVLRGVYGLVNKRYLALSRQMEFHADAMAAFVSGSAPLVSSLRRLETADGCYNQVLQYCNAWIPENKKAINIYPGQTDVMKLFGEKHGIKTEHGQLAITGDSFGRYNKSRVVIKDQWASHPSTDDREAHLNKLNVPSEIVTDSAWILFNDAPKLQQQITSSLYENVNFKTKPVDVGSDAFGSKYQEDADRYRFDERFKGYWDARPIPAFDPEKSVTPDPLPANLESLLTPEILNLPSRLIGLAGDLRMLNAINESANGIRTFDYDGTRYAHDHAPELIGTVAKELESVKQALEQSDLRVLNFLYQNLVRHEGEATARETFRMLADVIKFSENHLEFLGIVQAEMNKFFGNITVDAAVAVNSSIKQKEIALKEDIRMLMNDPAYAKFLLGWQRGQLEEYVAAKNYYFFNDEFNQPAIELFRRASDVYETMLNDRVFFERKSFFDNALRGA